MEGASSSELDTAKHADKSTAFEKLIDHFPYSGALRRRLITGVIFATLLVVYTLTFHAVPDVNVVVQLLSDAKMGIPSLFGSTQLMVLLVLFVYALGALIEVLSDGFIVRGAAGLSVFLDVLAKRLAHVLALLRADRHAPATTGDLPTTLSRHQSAAPHPPNRAVWIVTVLATFLCWPLMFVIAVILSTCSHIRYHVELDLSPTGEADDARIFLALRQRLSQEACDFYHKLPMNVQDGLDEPFGGRFESAWQELLHRTPPAHKAWLTGLSTKTHETSSFLSAALIATLAYLFWHAFHAGVHLSRGGNRADYLTLYAVLLFVAYCFLGYLSLVRRAIAAGLEFLAVQDATTRASPPDRHDAMPSTDVPAGTATATPQPRAPTSTNAT